MSVDFDNIPEELKQYDQWVVWQMRTPSTPDGKPIKMPLDCRTLKPASPTGPETWASYETVLETLQDNPSLAGIGFVFTENDPFTGIDFDNVIGETGAINYKTYTMLDKLRSYTEYSQSGKGLHVIVKGSLDGLKGNRNHHLEMYDRARYFCLTGNRLPHAPASVEMRQEELTEIHQQVFGKSTTPDVEEARRVVTSPPMSDDEVLSLVNAAKNGDKFRSLYYDGDISLYDDDHSAADLALCGRLSFYTQDAEQIDRLFRASALYRPKWDEDRPAGTYGEITIKKALDGLVDVYQPEGIRLSVKSANGATSNAEKHSTTAYTGNTIIHPNNTGISQSTTLKYLSVDGWAAYTGGEVEWLWEGAIPMRHMSLMQAAQKVGKSTLYRNLIASVIQGKDFLGRRVRQGKVVYLPLEEEPASVRDHFRRLGVDTSDMDNIIIPVEEKETVFYEEDGSPVISKYVEVIREQHKLEEVIRIHKPVLVVIDPIIAILRKVDDINKYDRVYNELLPMVRLATVYNCAILFTHHEGKSGKARENVGQRGIGSTAFAAVVAATLSLQQQSGGIRVLENEGRGIKPFSKLVLSFDEDTGRITAGGTYREDEVRRYMDRIIEHFENLETAISTDDLLQQIGGNPVSAKQAFLRLKNEGLIREVSGKGVKGDPYRYALQEEA